MVIGQSAPTQSRRPKPSGSFTVDVQPHLLRCRPDGSGLVISAASSRDLRLYDLAGKLLQTQTVPDSVQAIAWDSQGNRLAIACGDFHVYVWDIVSNQLRAFAGVHQALPVDIAFSPRGGMIASYGWDQTLRIWDAFEEREMLSIPSVYMFGPNVCAFSPHEDSLGYNAAFQAFGCWSLPTGRECRRFHVSKGPGKRLWEAQTSPDNRWLALARLDGVVLCDLEQMAEAIVLDAVTEMGHRCR